MISSIFYYLVETPRQGRKQLLINFVVITASHPAVVGSLEFVEVHLRHDAAADTGHRGVFRGHRVSAAVNGKP